MYHSLRLADAFGCATIGIQYQQGLKDLMPASDLVEGLLNNTDRPPVRSSQDGSWLYEGKGAYISMKSTNVQGSMLCRLIACGKSSGGCRNDLARPALGCVYKSRGTRDYVGASISGAAPAAHFRGGHRGAQRTAATHIFGWVAEH